MVNNFVRCVFRVIDPEEFKNDDHVRLGSIFFAIICKNTNKLKI